MKTDTTLWKTEITKKRSDLDFAPIDNALKLIKDEHHLAHGQAMVNELVKLNCDAETLTAALIYPTFYDKKITKDSLIKQLGNSVYKLANGALKMDAVHEVKGSGKKLKQSKQHADNLRRMILAMVDDIRVVLIKLAERSTTLRIVKNDEQKRKIVASEAMHIYAPLANRLGIGQFKWLLEDLSFRYLEPEQYHDISKKLNMRRHEREQFIHDMIERLTTLFEQSAIENASISGRAKHIYSIYKKLARKGGEFTEIFDTSAFRVLVPTLEDCYSALSIVHATWKHISKEFDDYIAKPKPNGYQSIHTAVIAPNNISVKPVSAYTVKKIISQMSKGTLPR